VEVQYDGKKAMLSHAITYTVKPNPSELTPGISISPQQVELDVFPGMSPNEVRLLRAIVPLEQTTIALSSSVPWITFGKHYRNERLIVVPLYIDLSSVSTDRNEQITLRTARFEDRVPVVVSIAEEVAPLSDVCSLGPVRPGATIYHQLHLKKSPFVNIIAIKSDVPGLLIQRPETYSDTRIIVRLEYSPGDGAARLEEFAVDKLGRISIAYERAATKETSTRVVPVQCFW
jgi:hypothetical protein